MKDFDILALLDQDFFDVVSSAIKAASFKREDFDKVKKVEATLEAFYALYQGYNSVPATGSDKFLNPSDKISTETPDVITNTEKGVAIEGGAKNQEISAAPKTVRKHTGILTPDEVKNAPTRQMPEDIKAIVEAGIEVAKNPPKTRPVQEIPMSQDPDEARKQWDAPLL